MLQKPLKSCVGYLQLLLKWWRNVFISLWIPDNLNHAGMHLQQLHRQHQLMAQTILQHGPENPLQAYTCNEFICGYIQRAHRDVHTLEKLVAKGDGQKFDEKLVQMWRKRQCYRSTSEWPVLRSSPWQTSQCLRLDRTSVSRHNSSCGSCDVTIRVWKWIWNLFCWESSKPLIRPPYLQKMLVMK